MLRDFSLELITQNAIIPIAQGYCENSAYQSGQRDIRSQSNEGLEGTLEVTAQPITQSRSPQIRLLTVMASVISKYKEKLLQCEGGQTLEEAQSPSLETFRPGMDTHGPGAT